MKHCREQEKGLAHGDQVADDLALVECFDHADQRKEHQAGPPDQAVVVMPGSRKLLLGSTISILSCVIMPS